VLHYLVPSISKVFLTLSNGIAEDGYDWCCTIWFPPSVKYF
jgi:hypothetical protein